MHASGGRVGGAGETSPPSIGRSLESVFSLLDTSSGELWAPSLHPVPYEGESLCDGACIFAGYPDRSLLVIEDRSTQAEN